MTSIERTAYPQFRRLTSARVLHVFFTPTAEEIGWAQERTVAQESLFALVLALKCFQSHPPGVSESSPACSAARYSCTRRTTAAPSPTAEATRLSDR